MKIDWDNPGELYFHLAEPEEETKAHPESFPHCMAVSQVLAFCLLVLESQHQNPRVITQDDRWNASQNLHAWTVDWELILREIPETERKHTPNPSPWHLRTYQGVDRSPYLLRPLDGGRFSRTCRSEVSQGEQDRRPSPKSSDEEMTPDSPLQRQRRPGGHGGSGKPQPPPGRSHCSAQQPQRGKQSRPYCSQRCLQGLVCREKLDGRCPNVRLHRKGMAWIKRRSWIWCGSNSSRHWM